MLDIYDAQNNLLDNDELYKICLLELITEPLLNTYKIFLNGVQVQCTVEGFNVLLEDSHKLGNEHSAYQKCTGEIIDEDFFYKVEDAYIGHFNSFQDYLEETDISISALPPYIKFCIDYEALWESYYRHSYMREDGYYFYNN